MLWDFRALRAFLHALFSRGVRADAEHQSILRGTSAPGSAENCGREKRHANGLMGRGWCIGGNIHLFQVKYESMPWDAAVARGSLPSDPPDIARRGWIMRTLPLSLYTLAREHRVHEYWPPPSSPIDSFHGVYTRRPSSVFLDAASYTRRFCSAPRLFPFLERFAFIVQHM